MGRGRGDPRVGDVLSRPGAAHRRREGPRESDWNRAGAPEVRPPSSLLPSYSVHVDLHHGLELGAAHGRL
jgi:hypothetical protein